MTLALVFWFALSVACDVGGQLCLKRGAEATSSHTGGMLRSLLGSPWVVAGVLIYALEVLVWLRILSEVPLSIAFPIASINFLGVTAASALLLGERVGRRQWLGASLITCGVIIVAQSA